MNEKNEEIVVRAPSKPVAHPEKKAERATQKALEEERFGVLQISHRLGEYFSASMILSGILLLFVFTYMMITGHMNWIVSPETTFLGLAVWIFASLTNIIGGLLLMGSK